MDNLEFFEWLKALYGAYGKSKPPEPHIVAAAYKRVYDLPDKFFCWAAEQFENRGGDNLPKNMGYELRKALWSEFLEKHPELKAHEENKMGCRECAGSIMPRLIQAWKPDTFYGPDTFVCVCNTLEAYAQRKHWTRKEILAAGYVLQDPTPQRPEAERYIPPHLRAVIGHTEPPRQDHLAQLDYAEAYAENW